MTEKTTEAVEAETYAGYRREAVACMRAMGVPDVDDSWDGMMKAVEHVKRHADREGEFGGAVMAAAKWVHGYLEEDTACAKRKAMEMVEREVSAAMEAKDPAEAAGAVKATAPSAASSAAKDSPRLAGRVPAAPAE